MHHVTTCAEEVLRSSTHPALRLSELVDILAPRVDRSLSTARLRTLLQGHPKRFRVIDPWTGPWRVREGNGLERHDAWVIAIRGPGVRTDTPPTALKLREGVRWLACRIDVRSPLEVSRWYAIVLAERAARQAVVRRAA